MERNKSSNWAILVKPQHDSWSLADKGLNNFLNALIDFNIYKYI